MWQAFTNALRREHNAIRVWPQANEPLHVDARRSPAPPSACNADDEKNSALTSPCLGIYRNHNIRISTRTSFSEDTINLRGWPSRGGVIILETASRPDFDFLHLDALDPPLRRDPDQAAEDAFCRALLRLGATWWDSEARHDFVRRLEFGEAALEAALVDENLLPTCRERGWVRVAWPSRPEGALCVLACEKIMIGRTGDETMRPKHCGLISLAKSMDERCAILQRLGGIMFAGIEEYNGPTFLKAWEEGHCGERDSLKKEAFIDPSIYGGHADDALGRFDMSRSSKGRCRVVADL